MSMMQKFLSAVEVFAQLEVAPGESERLEFPSRKTLVQVAKVAAVPATICLLFRALTCQSYVRRTAARRFGIENKS